MGRLTRPPLLIRTDLSGDVVAASAYLDNYGRSARIAAVHDWPEARWLAIIDTGGLLLVEPSLEPAQYEPFDIDTRLFRGLGSHRTAMGSRIVALSEARQAQSREAQSCPDRGKAPRPNAERRSSITG